MESDKQHPAETSAERLAGDDAVRGHVISDSGNLPDQAPSARRVTMRSLYEPSWLHTITSKYALVLAWIAMALVFYLMMPEVFGSFGAFSSIFGSQQVLIFLSMGALCTFVAGEFDLSFASVMGLTATIIPVLAGVHQMNIVLACIIGLAAAMIVGAINAFFVVVMDVSALVVTLGTGTLLIGVAQAISSSSIVSVSNEAFTNVTMWRVFGMPISFYYAIGLAVLFAYILSYTPLGRHLTFVGANREVARLAGIRVNSIRAGSYIVGAFLSGLAGLILVSSVGGFDPSSSTVFLLPALASVFLGTAVVQPGKFNPMGTLIAVFFLSTGIFGLQLLGLSSWIQNVFYGGGLVVAVTIAKVVRDRSRTA